ncbi:interferon kappa [Choloepus didactylus]|uniref:interferon kappa n=1 Tax=Choloepus didactylus TaxID=27675 RepID=UPI00189C7452|nr:interferon kappa [Choloepus didactylus]
MNIEPKMIRICLWPSCLVGLFITDILSLDCNLLNVHLSIVTWQNLRLLSSMSNSFPVECLREIEDFELPQEILSYTQPVKKDIKEVFYEMYIQAFNILNQYTFKSTWEEKCLKQILIRLDWQIQYLERCLEEEEKENEDMKQIKENEINYSGASVPQLNNLELRRYFNRIENFLKDKKYSYCAWEIVRIEIRRCFYYFQKFTALLKRK